LNAYLLYTLTPPFVKSPISQYRESESMLNLQRPEMAKRRLRQRRQNILCALCDPPPLSAAGRRAD
jgi:hypothetical protein